MPDQNIDLGGLVRTIVEPIVDYKDDLVVDEKTNGNGDVRIEIHVNEEDAGKVIGRQGRVIKSIRTLTRAAGMRAGVHVDVELID